MQNASYVAMEFTSMMRYPARRRRPSAPGEGSGGAAVEQLLGEPVQLHARALAVGQHRVDPRPRAADRGDPVQGVLAAEDREGTRAAGQPDDAAGVAQQDLPDAGVVLVALVAEPWVVVEVAARLGFGVHHGDGELAVVEVPAELVAVAEDRDF